MDKSIAQRMIQGELIRYKIVIAVKAHGENHDNFDETELSNDLTFTQAIDLKELFARHISNL